MDQFMNREEGIQALKNAIQQLDRAGRFLHEREGERENLSGSVCSIIGGTTDALYGLVGVLEDGLPKVNDDDTPIKKILGTRWINEELVIVEDYERIPAQKFTEEVEVL